MLNQLGDAAARLPGASLRVIQRGILPQAGRCTAGSNRAAPGTAHLNCVSLEQCHWLSCWRGPALPDELLPRCRISALGAGGEVPAPPGPLEDVNQADQQGLQALGVPWFRWAVLER